MLKMKARDLLQFTPDELWELLCEDHILMFDDGEIHCTWRETIYSSYAWAFHREFPETPMLKAHHIRSILDGKRPGPSSHLRLLEACMWSSHDAYQGNQDGVAIRDYMSRRIYEITNEIYVQLSLRAEDHVQSLDIKNFSHVLRHPEIKARRALTEPTGRSIEESNAFIKNALMKWKDFDNNTLALALRSKLVNDNQALQCVGHRGFITDGDSNLFRTPVLRCYAEGIRLLHDSLIESRSATKALLFSKAPLQAAEYFSRRLQLMSQVVKNLHHCDCGTTKYMLWHIRPRVVENNEVVFPGDLQHLVGMNYITEDGSLKAITINDKHLIGTTVKLRTVIHCAHPDPNGVCSTCFGELSLSIPANTNLGQMCCTSLAQKSSQSVLSVKHLDGSAAVDWIVLDDLQRNYMRVSADGSSYVLSESMKH